MTKWLTGVSPYDRAVYVAARSLESRLDAVRRYLRRSVKKPNNPENVHQLRVWSRRAEAALSLYADLIPARKSERMHRILRKALRAAGRVRDCDVFAAQTARSNGHWAADLRSERVKAQRKLVALFEKLDCGRTLKRRESNLVHRLREQQADSTKTFLQRACESLRPLLTNFFAASPEPTSDEKSLHKFRIAGKSLRYAIELLAGAFPPEMRDELYPTLSALQEKLGMVNDLAVARERLHKHADDTGKPAKLSDLRRRAADTSEALARAKAEFYQWWTPEAARSLQSRFEELVGTPATIR
jgi:CHAD domain-containing protein